MTLGSKTVDGKKIYSFEMTEEEFENTQKGETVHKIVEWSKGRGKFSLAFKKIK